MKKNYSRVNRTYSLFQGNENCHIDVVSRLCELVCGTDLNSIISYL